MIDYIELAELSYKAAFAINLINFHEKIKKNESVDPERFKKWQESKLKTEKELIEIEEKIKKLIGNKFA